MWVYPLKKLNNMWHFDDKGNKIHSTAVITENVELGNNNVIYPYTVIGMLGFIRGEFESTGKIIVGDNNMFGTHCTIMCGLDGVTKIGDNNLIMNYSNVGHDVTIGNDNEVGPRTILAGWSELGDGNKLKLAINVRNRIKIGSGNIIGMSSNVVKDIGDNKLLYGNPCKVVKELKDGRY